MDTKLLDSLWNHYWVNTLSTSSLITNAEYTTGQVRDLADKLESWDHNMSRGYKYDRNVQQNMLTAKPWEKDPHFFKDIKVSALALLKMVMHAR